MSATFTVTTPSPVRLVDYAKQHLVVVPVDRVGELIAAGAIQIDTHVGKIAELVREGDVLTVDRAALAAHAFEPQDLAIKIHHEDTDLMVCEKPAGIHVHPVGPHRTHTLLNGLLVHCGARVDHPWGAWRPAPMHRLDRAASGLIAIAKAASIHDAVRKLFASGGITRRYRAMVHGVVAGDAGTINAPLGRDPTFDYRRTVVPIELGGRPAITHWTVIARHPDRTLLELVLDTGRTHQIRAHLASLGHPIIDDTLYSAATQTTSIALHASELRLHHPRTNEELVCLSPPPPGFGQSS